MKSAMDYMYEKIRIEYEMIMMNYEERMRFLEQDSMEVISQLQSKADAKVYLHMIEAIKDKQLTLAEEIAPDSPYSKKVGSVASADAYEMPADEYESKLASSIVVEVHDSPKIPEGFGKGKRKKKGRASAGGESAVTAQELDAEYFAFQEEQQKAMETSLAVIGATQEDEEERDGSESIFGALKRFGFGNRKK